VAFAAVFFCLCVLGLLPSHAGAAPLVQEAKLTAFDPAELALFGWSVAIDADTAVAGSPDIFTETGAAYVFVNTEQGWSLSQKLTAGGNPVVDGFGYSVAVSNDTVVVGAPWDDADVLNDSGSVYVFARSGDSWNLQQKLTAADPSSNLQFGIQVAISGETIAIGSGGSSDSVLYSGAVYVFSRSGASWSQQQKLTANDAGEGDLFGYLAVAIAGDTILVGASGDDDAGPESGSAYVFERNGTTWTQQQKLMTADARSGALFGDAVAISDKTAVVGSPNYDSAYVFVKIGSVWEEQQTLTGNDIFGGHFGGSVAIDGHRILIGARSSETAAGGLGTVYVFVGNKGHWERQQKFPEPGATVRRCFGQSVAISGDKALVGSPCDNESSEVQLAGSAYVYGEAKHQAAAASDLEIP
jgi:hypothetical protein